MQPVPSSSDEPFLDNLSSNHKVFSGREHLIGLHFIRAVRLATSRESVGGATGVTWSRHCSWLAAWRRASGLPSYGVDSDAAAPSREGSSSGSQPLLVRSPPAQPRNSAFNLPSSPPPQASALSYLRTMCKKHDRSYFSSATTAQENTFALYDALTECQGHIALQTCTKLAWSIDR